MNLFAVDCGSSCFPAIHSNLISSRITIWLEISFLFIIASGLSGLVLIWRLKSTNKNNSILGLWSGIELVCWWRQIKPRYYRHLFSSYDLPKEFKLNCSFIFILEYYNSIDIVTRYTLSLYHIQSITHTVIIIPELKLIKTNQTNWTEVCFDLVWFSLFRYRRHCGKDWLKLSMNSRIVERNSFSRKL